MYSVFKEKPEDFNIQVETAGCYLVCKGKVLFLHRATHVVEGGTWGIPGGKFEKGETAQEAACREVFEESAIDLSNPFELTTLYIRLPQVDYTFHIFYQELDDYPSVELNAEHQDYRWVTVEEALDLPLIKGGREALQHFCARTINRQEFYFIRHGETDVNADSTLKRVDYDIPLNEKGRLQALAVPTVEFKSVCFSPLQRAVETKDLIVNGANIRHLEIMELRECRATVWKKMVEESICCSEVSDFLIQSLLGINKALQQDGPILIVSHGGVHWALCQQLMIEDHPWRIGNCELVHFTPIEGDRWKARILHS